MFVLLFSLFVARSFLKPPFLVSQPGGKLGVGKAIHPAWGTAVHNPKHDFGFLYEVGHKPSLPLPFSIRNCDAFTPSPPPSPRMWSLMQEGCTGEPTSAVVG